MTEKGVPVMIKKQKAVLLLALLLLVQGLHAQRQRPVTITIASSLPRNSPWGRSLDRIAADWSKITSGEITLKVLHQYPGSEGEYMMKLRQDKIQGAVFTSIALNQVTPEIMALSIPLFIRNNAELDEVLRQVRPLLDERIERQGFVNLVWAKIGWIKIFSRSPVKVPNDLRRLKVGTSPDERELADAFKAMGFQMVGVNLPEVVQFLNGGKIDAVYQSPISVDSFQLYRVANHMSSINLAPFMGGILLSKMGWERIPERYRPQLLAVTQQAGRDFEASFQKSEEDAIANMRRNGIIVTEASPQDEEEWYRDMAQRLPEMIDKNIFNKEMYDRILVILQNYRQGR
jgi:TRAP-type C4-dicarboxylate transport system substrate-binding protein